MISRIRQWWNRPSYAVLESRLRSASEMGQSFQSLYDTGLGHRVELQGENEKLKTELEPCRAAIQDVLDNGADEEAWPPGTDYYECLGSYVARLHDQIRDLLREVASQDREIASRGKEIDRLMSIIADPKILEIAYKNGELRVSTEPHFAMKALAMSFAETLGKSPNYVSMSFGPMDSDQGRIVATVERVHGKSPACMVSHLKSLLAELTETTAFRSDYWHDAVNDKFSQDACARRAKLLAEIEEALAPVAQPFVPREQSNPIAEFSVTPAI